MNGWLSLAVLVVASSVMLALLCAATLALATRLAHRRLERAAMQGRTRLLTMLAVAPMAISCALMGLCLAPSLLARVGVMSDHCLTSIHDHMHLCLQHLPTVGPTSAAWLFVALAVAAFGTAGWTGGGSLARGHLVWRALRTQARPDASADDVLWIDSPTPLALTAGLLRPRVFMTRGFERALGDEELRAALAHERCHARERHGLLKLVALCGSVMHGPLTRARLLALLDLASERRADEDAAREVGDRLNVASAIVRAHRAMPRSSSPLVLALSGSDPSNLERRVHALLAPPEHPMATGERRLLLAVSAAAVAASFEIHHAVEIAVSLLV